MVKLTKYDLQKLEEYWTNHASNKKQLKFREWELTARDSSDENGGRSPGISKPTEAIAQKLLTDRRYQNLQTIINVIERLYQQADQDLKAIIEMRYWDNACFYEWEEIADHLNMSRNKVLRIRNGLLDATAHLIGWV